MLLFQESSGVAKFLENNWPTLIGYIGMLLLFAFRMGQLRGAIDKLTENQKKSHEDLERHASEDRRAHEQMNGLQQQIDTGKHRLDRQIERQDEDRGVLRETVRLLDLHIKTADIHINPRYDHEKHEDLLRRIGGMESAIKQVSVDLSNLDKRVAIILAKTGGD